MDQIILLADLRMTERRERIWALPAPRSIVFGLERFLTEIRDDLKARRFRCFRGER
jgi:hypothetical protein